jgi:AcrR family transcriptional regulator
MIAHMPRPPHAREKLVDAFESLLIDGGARAATMDATARAAGVSKGGLVYHFPAMDALAAALAERLERLNAADLAELSAAPEGLVEAFVRTSVPDGSPLDRCYLAVTTLAQEQNAAAIATLERIHRSWEDALRPHTRDETALRVLLLLCDGIYISHAVGDRTLQDTATMDAVIARVAELTR